LDLSKGILPKKLNPYQLEFYIEQWVKIQIQNRKAKGIFLKPYTCFACASEPEFFFTVLGRIKKNILCKACAKHLPLLENEFSLLGAKFKIEPIREKILFI